MKNKLIFGLVLIATLFPQWSAIFNVTATAIWLWLPEFKLDAINLVLEQNYTRIKADNNFGINATMLDRWVKEH